MEFKEFKDAVQRQFDRLQGYGDIFRVAVDRDLMWETYLGGFREGDDPIFRERSEHDCSACRGFIKHGGSMVAIHDGKLVSLWDLEIGGKYQPVADAMAELIKAQVIENVFMHGEVSIGVDKNFEKTEDSVTTWEHFYLLMPESMRCASVVLGSTAAHHKSTFDVMLRSLREITIDALETVLDLVGQKSLYRGEEHLKTLQEFLKLKKEFIEAEDEELFCWPKVLRTPQPIARVRNTSIGTLLVDLSEGKELEASVSAFEKIVAPENYQRPTALVTKKMIADAKETVENLGLTAALARRFAELRDVSITDTIFADRTAREKMLDVFAEVAADTPDKVPNLDKIEEITIDTFIDSVLPKANTVELMVENRHTPNFVSLIAPVDPDAKMLFKWANPFSWSYTGDVADSSIKDRVKTAGGSVTGELRVSLGWFNRDDLDVHMDEPTGAHIFYGHRFSKLTGGTLDVDMNAGGVVNPVDPVENITYANRNKMKEGLYRVAVHQYARRVGKDVGFEVEIEFDGEIHRFSYPKMVRQGSTIKVADVRYRDGKFSIEKAHLESSQTPRTVWGLKTQTFHKVDTVTLSPNHWNGHPVGNRHYMFFLNGCQNDEPARGFFNEFLTPELSKHRKVLEIVGSKVKVGKSENQLSGLGFSSTKRDTAVFRVRGSFNRDLKVRF
jgi:hypothetical protein